MTLRIKAIETHLGAELIGTLSSAGAAAQYARRLLLSAVCTHVVVLVRDLSLTPDRLLYLAWQLGTPMRAPSVHAGIATGHPYVLVVSNRVGTDGLAVGVHGHDELGPHADQTYLLDPPELILLFCLEAPSAGGVTQFFDMYAAYDALPTALRARVDNGRLKHDAVFNSAGQSRPGARFDPDPRLSEGVVHPMVRIHPTTGRRALCIGRRRHAYVCGCELAESEDVLDALWAHATQERFAVAQEWRPGDLLMFDNLAALHSRTAFASYEPRTLYRAQVRNSWT